MKILIAVDDSTHSARAVEFVTRMRWPKGSRMIVMSVMPPSSNAGLSPYPLTSARRRAALTEQRRRHDAVVERAQCRLREAGFSTEGRIVEGDARERLIEIVERERVDLLVMGSRGRTGIARLMLGSVSSHAVTHAPCSVLVVKQPAGR